MSVKIRMKRVGTKKRPMYRIVVAEAGSPRDGRNIEEIGSYNPMVKPKQLKLKMDRAEHWIKVGAQPSGVVSTLIKRARKESGKAATK